MINCRLCAKKVILQKKLSSRLDKYLFLCDSCKTYFINPKQYSYDNSSDELIEYYLKLEDMIAQRLDKIFRHFIKLNPKGASVLDIGSGLGFGGKVANSYGLDYIGIEPNKTLSEYSKVNHSINSINDYFPSSKVDAKFDFIILDNVLEHLYEPRELFDEIVKHLNPSGVFFLACPPTDWLRVTLATSDVVKNSKLSRTFKIFEDLQQHVNYFSDDSIRYLVSNHDGLEIASMFHKKEWSVPFHKLLGLTTGEYFIQKNIEMLK